LLRHLIAHGYNNFNVLIVGTGDEADELLDEIKAHPYLGLRVEGFLAQTGAQEHEGIPVLGTYADAEKVVREHFIDEILIAASPDRETVRHILACADRLNRNVRVVADSYGLAPRDIEVVNLGVLQMLSYRHARPGSAHSAMKRAFDLCATFVGGLCIAPIIFLIAALIKLDSKGPVLYVSKRAGYKGRIFDFYKFRTMIVDADAKKQALMVHNEVKGGKIFKIKNDPRLTRIGAFLRKYSLDELPQLLNVLKGDMSLVGPRPFPVHEFRSFDPYHKARAEAKPGITGIAQVKGRSDLSFHHWMKWDIWYVDNWSLWLDVLVLFWTFPAVVKGKGAY
jgi:exopolysaccharide biosynthesis polyprenyl glycosylphosphotransferase